VTGERDPRRRGRRDYERQRVQRALSAVGAPVDENGRDHRACDEGRNVLEIPIPQAAPEVTVMKLTLGGLPGFAGRFADLLSCAEQDGAVEFGYTFGSHKDAEYVVSPLLEAGYRALGEDAK
jgi:hypothetical protein